MKHIVALLTILFIFIAAFLFVVYSSRTPESARGERDEGKHSDALEALDFWTRARAYPDKDISPDKFYRAFLSAKTARKRPPRTVLSSSTWESIGPVNLQGRAISVAINPLNGNTVYVGSASGGLWRSYTGGLGHDWMRVNTGYPVLGVGAIAIDPTDSNAMYIGTGEVYQYQLALGGVAVRTTRGSYGIGILKTGDGGRTWTKSLDWTFNQERGVQDIRINPLNHNTIWAATTEGIYKSTDGGTTWDVPLPVAFGIDLALNPLDTNKLLASCGNLGYTAFVYRTSDGGATWDVVSPTQLPELGGKTMLEMYAANPNVVYASVAAAVTDVGALYRSTNFGISWTKLYTPTNLYQVQGWYSHFVAVHPTDSTKIVYASVSTIKSTNGGTTFSFNAGGYGGGNYADNHNYAHHPTNPNILYVVNDDGVYRSTDFGSSFTSVGYGMQTGQFYNGFSNSSGDSLIAIGQVQDHIPGYIYTGSPVWGRSVLDECGWTAIDPLNDNIMYAVDRNGGDIGKSDDRGASFSYVGFLPANGSWNSPLMVAPSNTNTLYLGQDRVYKSTTGGLSWSSTNTSVFLDGNLSLSMAISYSSPDTVYVGKAPTGTQAHLFRTTNGGGSWTDITGSTPDRYPMDIAVDPNNSRIVYVAFGGANAGHLFKSTDAGTTWVDDTGELPDVPTTAVIVDPSNSNYVYVGSDIGVYVSTNGGVNWNTFTEGLPEAVLVSDLTISPSNRMLRATTHGNGVYERKMPTMLPFVSIEAPNGGEQWDATTSHTITWSKELVGAVRLDYSTDNGATWTTIADSVTSGTGSYDWHIPFTLTTEALVRAVALSDTTTRDQSNGVFQIVFHGIVTHQQIRWNLVSLPAVVADGRISQLFPTSLTSAFRYAHTYISEDSLSIGTGYWMKFGTDQTTPVYGDTVFTDSIGVTAGWNLIGSITSPILTSSVQSDPPNITSTFFYGYTNRYAIADTIQPGKAYWIKSSGSGKLILSTTPVALRMTQSETNNLDKLDALIITDKNGNSQTLYFGNRDYPIDLQKYEMPPAPPPGAFDSRFTSGRIAEIAGLGETRSYAVRIQSATYAVSLAWRIVNGSEEWGIRNGNTVQSITASGSTVIASEPKDGTILLTYGGDRRNPVSFTLKQNIPNPFNPSTTIGYSLSNSEHVTLKVFDLLGREVALLVNERKDPGNYSFEWRASEQPSGVYLYRLEAGAFVQTKKMLLLK